MENVDFTKRPFNMKDTRNSECALVFWLKEREYNSWVANKKDRAGNFMIGLSMNYTDSYGHKISERRGVIVSKDQRAHDTSLFFVEKYSGDLS